MNEVTEVLQVESNIKVEHQNHVYTTRIYYTNTEKRYCMIDRIEYRVYLAMASNYLYTTNRLLAARKM